MLAFTRCNRERIADVGGVRVWVGWLVPSETRPTPVNRQNARTRSHTPCCDLSHLVAPVHSVDVPWRLVRVDLFSLGGSLSLIRHAAQATKPNDQRRKSREENPLTPVDQLNAQCWFCMTRRSHTHQLLEYTSLRWWPFWCVVGGEQDDIWR
jgi:hypothetical protein